MSNPRYTPRSYVLPARDFGRRRHTDWLEPDASWTPQEVAHLEASQLQHRIAYGVVEEFLPSSEIRTITALAAEVDIPYDRLLRMLNGRVVMQLEDVSRLRKLIGEPLGLWIASSREWQQSTHWPDLEK
ncbi:hypothetical protein HWD99_01845 [Microbacterium sp. C5A9]|uniref:hypothetical protein n=1 Tax=Microbacterium sp. C5A9 TaxID=2736663 RepID=UPI001F520099|nr:hypothetical protein [Microbacterium sp. C5A9]MCI1017360.1 hypothetical protein [Microbacterium sp. C5A9]